MKAFTVVAVAIVLLEAIVEMALGNWTMAFVYSAGTAAVLYEVRRRFVTSAR